MGHREIGTRALYDRENLTQADMAAVLIALDNSRLKNKEQQQEQKLRDKEMRKRMKQLAKLS